MKSIGGDLPKPKINIVAQSFAEKPWGLEECLWELFKPRVETLIAEKMASLEVGVGVENNFRTTGYLLEEQLIVKYKTSKTFLYKLMKEYTIERFKTGRFYNYKEADFIEACKKHNPKKPAFLRNIA